MKSLRSTELRLPSLETKPTTATKFLLDLGDVGVGALLEAECDGDAAVLVAGRGEVEQVVDTAELLLDDL